MIDSHSLFTQAMQRDGGGSNRFSFEVVSNIGLPSFLNQYQHSNHADLFSVEKALVDLYPVFMRHDQIKAKTQNKSWLDNSSPSHVFTWLMREYSNLLPIDTYPVLEINRNNSNDSEFCIVNNYTYPEIENYMPTYWTMPLNFLPDLAKTNIRLHDLLVSALILMHDICDVGVFYYHDWLFDVLLDNLGYYADDAENAENEENSRIMEETESLIDFYQHGLPKDYSDLIINPKHIPTLAEFQNNLDAFVPCDDLESVLHDLAVKAQKIIINGSKLSDFDDDNTEGLGPRDYMNFSWSVSDLLADEIIRTLENYYNNDPLNGPILRQSLTAANAEIIAPKNNFPVMLGDFFEHGNNLIDKLFINGDRRKS